MLRKNWLRGAALITLAGGCVILGGTPAWGSYYVQNFDSPDTLSSNANGQSLANFGWASHRNQNGGIALTSNVGVGTAPWPAEPVTTASSAQVRIVDDTAAPSGTNRAFLFWNSDTAEDILSWTNGFAPVPVATATSVSFFHRNSDGAGSPTAGPNTRVALAVDTGSGVRWFAQATGSTNNTATWTQVTANPALANGWIEFTFDGTLTTNASAGFELTGSPVSLPAGNLVAAGIYSQMDAAGSNGDSVRFDSFTIVPEPTSAAVFGGAMTTLAGLRRRRRSAYGR